MRTGWRAKSTARLASSPATTWKSFAISLKFEKASPRAADGSWAKREQGGFSAASLKRWALKVDDFLGVIGRLCLQLQHGFQKRMVLFLANGWQVEARLSAFFVGF